jgi:hypothetical protein
MGLESTSLSLTRFKLIGFKKSTSLTQLNELCAAHQARPLKLQGSNKEESVGWIRPPVADVDGLSEKDEWSLSDCRLDGGFYLRLRSERRRISGSLFRNVYKEALIRREAKRTNPLSRAERKELTAETKRELLQMCLPSLSFVDGFWRADTGELMVFSASAQAVASFENLFRESFVTPLEMSMVQISLPLMGLLRDVWDDESTKTPDWIQKISLTIPSSFVEHSA